MELQRDRRYTYADYAAWDDGKRYELVDGVPYSMAPAPTRLHQKISVNLTNQIYNHLKGKKCEVYAAPFDVRLNADAGDDTVVQPDITVVCDPGKLDARGCKGVPDMIVEILSPSTVKHDQFIKFNKYQETGVREYWIVHPDEGFVAVNLLVNGGYLSQAYGDTATVPITVLDDCPIHLADVFPPMPAQP